MRKLCFALVLVGVSIWAVAPSGAAPNGDSVHGGGKFLAMPDQCDQHFAINARSGPNGENPDGTMHITSAKCGNDFKANVICVRVVGNQASILAAYDRTTVPRVEGGGERVFLEDNGNPQGEADRQQNTKMTEAEFAVQRMLGCPPPIEPRTPLENGNIVINDG
jgi:hypothetical protein